MRCTRCFASSTGGAGDPAGARARDREFGLRRRVRWRATTTGNSRSHAPLRILRPTPISPTWSSRRDARGQGIGQWMIEAILAHPDLQGLRRMTLLTRDAQELYKKFGFTTDMPASTYMELRPQR